MSAHTRPGQFHIRLHPACGGRFTEWRISGSTPTAIPSWHLRRLMQAMCLWSGWPVSLALPAEVETARWFSWWTDALADVPPEHLHVDYAVARSAPMERDDG